MESMILQILSSSKNIGTAGAHIPPSSGDSLVLPDHERGHSKTKGTNQRGEHVGPQRLP